MFNIKLLKSSFFFVYQYTLYKTLFKSIFTKLQRDNQRLELIYLNTYKSQKSFYLKTLYSQFHVLLSIKQAVKSLQIQVLF